MHLDRKEVILHRAATSFYCTAYAAMIHHLKAEEMKTGRGRGEKPLFHHLWQHVQLMQIRWSYLAVFTP